VGHYTDSPASRVNETHLSHLYGTALTSLKALRSSGNACTKIVTASLVDSCGTLETTDGGFDKALKHLHMQLAAVLALCELQRDPADWPTDCINLQYPGQADEAEVKHCFAWLKADGKRWTSYSNNRASLQDICHAERYRVEKGRNLAHVEQIDG
jgi:hypothetical protein